MYKLRHAIAYATALVQVQLQGHADLHCFGASWHSTFRRLDPRIVRLLACDWPPAPRPAPSEITYNFCLLVVGLACARIRLLPGTDDAKAGIGGT